MPQNIYLYVDESGQETEGVFFVVAVVMASQDLDACYQTCVELEQQSGKLARKWTKVQHSRRMEYLRLVFQNRLFAGNLA